jgi:hypothetical protein
LASNSLENSGCHSMDAVCLQHAALRIWNLKLNPLQFEWLKMQQPYLHICSPPHSIPLQSPSLIIQTK